MIAPPGSVNAARRFYGGLVGLREIDRPASMGGEGVWFSVGDQELHVSTDADFTPAKRAHPALRLSDDAALNDLASRNRLELLVRE